MMADNQVDLLRFGIAEGSVSEGTEHSKLFDSTVTPQWFMTYNAGTSVWVDETKRGWLYSQMLHHFEMFGVGPTQGWLENTITGSTELTDREKSRLITDVTKMVRTQRQSTQFESTLTVARESYLRDSLARTLASAPEAIRNSPSKALELLLRDLAGLQESTELNPRAERPKSLEDFIFDNMSELTREDHASARPFPWESWNEAFGGKKCGEVAIIAGRYSSGKSFVCKEILFKAADECKEDEFVVIADLEMTQTQLFFRWAARATGLPISKISTNQLSEKEELVFQETMSLLYESAKHRQNLLFLPAHGCYTTRAIRNNISRFGQGRTPVELGVDYVTLMRPSFGHLQSWEAMGQVIIELKELSTSLNIPVISPIHLNKDEQTQFQVVDQRADVVYRLKPERGREPKPPKDGAWIGTPGIIRAEATRNRSGATGSIAYLEVEFSTASIQDAPGGRRVAF
jgi:replicative DNA helicase